MKAITIAEKVLDAAIKTNDYKIKTRLVNPSVEIINADGFTIFEYTKSGRGNEQMYFERGNRAFHYMFGKQRGEKDYWSSDIETGEMFDIEIPEFENSAMEFIEEL